MALDIKVEQFCMVLSRYRVIQGLALYYSLQKTMKNFIIYILCMDDEVLDFIKIMMKENAIPISVKQIEDTHLSHIKQNRLLDEYCWTLKPVFLEFILNNYMDITRITYIDADLFFYSEPNKIFEGIKDYSVLLSRHDFSRRYTPLEISCGTYNSGLISFSSNEEGRSCIKWWKSKCYNLCSKQFSDNQFGDQKYLEEMPEKFHGAAIIKGLGVNIAPWNHSKYIFKNIGDHVLINNRKLCCYHFSGFRLVSATEFSLNFGYEIKPNPILYMPYLQMINQAMLDYQKVMPANLEGFIDDSLKKGSCLYKVTMFNNSK